VFAHVSSNAVSLMQVNIIVSRTRANMIALQYSNPTVMTRVLTPPSRLDLRDERHLEGYLARRKSKSAVPPRE
jgi:hypothetical protein